VDEPDLVKTDGRRIVSVTGGVLRVVDAQTRQLTATLDLSSVATSASWAPANLLLVGNHALVLFDQTPIAIETPGVGDSNAGSSAPAMVAPIETARLVLVDLSSDAPQILSEYSIDGSLLDARLVGSVARVVVQSAPRLYPQPEYGAPSAVPGPAASADAGVSQWLPRFSVTTGGATRTGLVDCAWVSHPAVYTGSSMLTVLTFDLNGVSLGDGQPVTIVADGDTVYSDGTSLYVAAREWVPAPENGPSASGPATGIARQYLAPAAQYTAIYKFDISGPGRPLFEASGSVPGWLLGSSDTAEYSLSAWNGALRVATTTFGWSAAPGAMQVTESAVYVLEQEGSQLGIVGKIGGLGAGEQIYAVRFTGPIGYVATFRQTDPLYTLDLSDPAQPRLAGELQLSGYSAFLYPIDDTHMIGIGQDANELGETTGTQVSLFDVSDIAAPVRVATFDLPSGYSEAEFDPHAFLYWPASRLLVIPVQLPYAITPPPAPEPQGGAAQSAEIAPAPSAALVLRVTDQGFTELGTVTHPVDASDPAGGQIRRSLIIGSALWTLSDAGLKANDSSTLAPLAWVSFTPGASNA
jgi:hypothetical protein